MLQPTWDNAAGRLFELITQAKNIHPHTEMRKAWFDLLGLKERSTRSQLLRRIGAVMSLPLEAEAEIWQLRNVDHAHFLLWVKPVNRAFSVLNLDGEKWATFRAPFEQDNAPLHTLQMAADQIHRQLPHPPPVPAEELDLILSQVLDLRNEIRNAETIDLEVKDFFLRHLWELERAIEMYDLRGAAGIREAVQSAMGALYVRPEVAAKAGASPHGRKYGQIIGALLLALSLSADAYTLAEPARQLLFPPPATVEQAAPNATPDLESHPETPLSEPFRKV